MSNERPCVRCGERPRHDDSFICEQCAADPQYEREIKAARRVVGPEHRAQRDYLVHRRGWVGGWSIRRGSVRA